MKSTEKQTQKACIEYLTLKKIFFWRQNSGGFKTESGHFYSMGIVGAPDIFCGIKGQCIALEIKDVHGKQNDNQKLFQQNLERAGGRYYIIRSLDDLIKVVG